MVSTTRLHVEPLDGRVLPSFSPATSYAVGASPRAVVTADFNTDGQLDIAVANTGSGTVSVLLGNGNGTFQPAASVPTGNHPTALAVGDFNEDGSPDLVTADGDGNGYTNAVTVLVGNGAGTFAPPAGYQVGWGYGVDTLAVSDFNADGHLDLAVTSLFFEDGGSDGSYLGALLGTGAGTFTTLPEQPWERGWSRFGGTELLPDSVVFDAGARHIAAPSYYGQLPVAVSYGDGTFSDHTVYGGASEASAIVAADLNADGQVDLAIAGNSSVTVLIGFGAGQTYAAGSGSLSDLAVADFNGDGKLDLIATNSSTGTAVVLLGTGTGAFALATDADVGAGPAGLAVGDFNGDGRADAVTANATSGTVSVLLNDGDWGTPPPPRPSLRIGDVTVAEGNTGTRTATFTVTLSAASGQTVIVNYSTANGTATAGDYQAAAGTVTFAPGETTKTITVLVNGDRIAESSETFSVNLGSPTNATIADGLGIGTIADDEPRVSIGEVTKKESNGKKTTLFTFTVTLSAAYDQAVTMSFQTVNGTATTADGDYVAKTGTITFAPGETTKTITIEVKADNKREANELFYLDLFGLSNNGLFTKSRGVGTILNDD